MKITRVEAIPYAIPYRKPLRFASGEVRVAEHVLVRVHTDDGVVGVAERRRGRSPTARPRPASIAVIEGIFAPAVVGLDPVGARDRCTPGSARTVGNPAAKLGARHGGVGRPGPVPRPAASPSLLGGYTDRMRVSHMLGFDEPAAMVAEAEPDARHLRHHDVQGEGRAPAAHPRHRRGPRAARGARRRRRAVRRRQPRLVRLGVGAGDGARWPTSASPSPRSCARPTTCSGRRWLVQQSRSRSSPTSRAVTPADVTREVLGGSATAVSIKTARTGFTASRRVHHLAEGLGRRGRDGQPDRRPARVAVLRRVRRRRSS